jgi:hypothetical protein
MSLILLGILNSQAAAAGGGAAYDLLETQVLTSSASSVTFTGLGSYSDYKHLQIRGVFKLAVGTSGAFDLYTTFNSDTSGIYATHRLYGTGASVVSTSSTALSNFTFTDIVPRGADVGEIGNYGVGVMDILDFSKTTKNTTLRFLAGAYTTEEKTIGLFSGLYNSTSAITAVSLFIPGANLFTGSRFSIFGIKGA